MKPNKPTISVVIPAFNEAAYLPKCLESLKNQVNAPSYEVIVVDNASTDNTAKVAKKFGANVYYEQQPGVIAARQKGLKNANGAIIVSSDADCYFSPNWLHNIYKEYSSNPEIVGLAGHYHFYKAPLWAKILPPLGAVFIWLVSKVTGDVIYASAANLSFKKSAFPNYNTNFLQGADERGVINEISKVGKIKTTLSNPVYTSPRRVNQGFIHSIFVTICYYYGYGVWQTKKHGHSKISAPPAIRSDGKLAHWPLLTMQWVLAVSLASTLLLAHRLHIWQRFL